MGISLVFLLKIKDFDMNPFVKTDNKSELYIILIFSILLLNLNSSVLFMENKSH